MTQHCKSCLEPQETPEGIININENGLCDSCQDKKDMGKILTEDLISSQDFDFTMNN